MESQLLRPHLTHGHPIETGKEVEHENRLYPGEHPGAEHHPPGGDDGTAGRGGTVHRQGQWKEHRPPGAEEDDSLRPAGRHRDCGVHQPVCP